MGSTNDLHNFLGTRIVHTRRWNGRAFLLSEVVFLFLYRLCTSRSFRIVSRTQIKRAKKKKLKPDLGIIIIVLFF